MASDHSPYKLTRREFLGLPSEDLTSGEKGSTTKRMSEDSKRERQRNHPGQSLRGRLSEHLPAVVLTVTLVVLVVATLGGPVSAAESAQMSGDVQSSETIDAQERALALMTELERLDSKSGVDVSETVTGAIRDDLAQGNASYRENNFEEAKQHYDEAAEKARSALTKAHVQRSELLLNSSSSHIRSLESHGYRTADISMFVQRIENLRLRSESVDSLGDARDLHRDARTLEQDVLAGTPSPKMVAVVDMLLGGWGVALIAMFGMSLFGIGGVIGIRIDRRLRNRDNDEQQPRRPVTGASNKTGQVQQPRGSRVEYED
jgi:hypothetical protein